MKNLLSILIFAMGCSLALAAPPENYPASRYIDLYRNSPFTDAPPVEVVDDVPNDLVDWTMVGLRKSVDSVVVTLLNTKNRNERIKIPSKEASEMGFAIREVKYERNFLNSEVILQKGIHTGKVTFDPKFLVLKAVAAPAGQKVAPASNLTPNTRGNTPPVPGGAPPVPGGAPPVPGGAPPVPGSTPTPTSAPSTGSKVPVPTATPAATNVSSKKSTGRTRYVPRPKK